MSTTIEVAKCDEETLDEIAQEICWLLDPELYEVRPMLDAVWNLGYLSGHNDAVTA